MQIQPLTDWIEFCRQCGPGFRKFIADPQASQAPKPCGDQTVCIAIGPEGGFTEGEILAGRDAGWESVSLGPRILRVETAAIALSALFALGF
jgi:16S rRNA (uracil1498-N3)-methyltransferase